MDFPPDSDELTTIVELKKIYSRLGALLYPTRYQVYRAPEGSDAARPFRSYDTIEEALAAVGPNAVVVHVTNEPDSEGHTHTVFTF